jgi:hypothetical protein
MWTATWRTTPGRTRSFRSASVLLLYCAEWTTHRGHGTALSDRPYDHKALYDVRDARDVKIGAVKRRLGIHLSANHPGGSDHFGFSYDLGGLHRGLELGDLAAQRRGAGHLGRHAEVRPQADRRGGSDSHHGYPDTPAQATRLSYEAPANNVGTPTTWVFARARTKAAVVAALTNGRASVSANPFSPRVEFLADRDGDGRMDMMMGDNAAGTGRPVRFRVQLTAASRRARPMP